MKDKVVSETNVYAALMKNSDRARAVESEHAGMINKTL